MHAPINVHVLGGVVVCAALSSGGTYKLCQCNSVGDIAAVCTASSHFYFLEMFFFFFFHWQCFCIWAHSILLLFSSLLLFFFSVILFLWLYLTALNCCSPAVFFLIYICFGVQLWE